MQKHTCKNRKVDLVARNLCRLVSFCKFAARMKRIFPLCILLLMFGGTFISAQEILRFASKQFNYGTVVNWDNPPAEFVFTNESVNPQYILAPKHNRNVLVEYPKMRIESGEEAVIRVYYYTEKTGSFSEDILIYVSGSKDPIKLNIKGNIKSLSMNALTACPPANLRTRFERPEVMIRGQVVDGVTGKPLAHAKVSFSPVASVYTNAEGNFQLRLPTGTYPAFAEATGYLPLHRTESIAREQKDLIFPLFRGEQPVAEVDTSQVAEEEYPDFPMSLYKPSNIVLLIDVSGSMNKDARIEQVKGATESLIRMIRPVDQLSILTFASTVDELFTGITGDRKDEMLDAIRGISAGGTTNSLGGLEGAYRTAQMRYIEGGNNQVILITDGRFAVGNSLLDMVNGFLERGLSLSVFGFSNEVQSLKNLEKLAKAGGGGFMVFEPGAPVDRLLNDNVRKNARK